MNGSIRKRSKNTWTVEISNGFDPITGKRLRKYLTVRGTKKDLQREQARVITEMETGTDLDPARISVAQFVGRWLEHMRTRVRPTTWRRYEQLLRVHVVPRIGQVQLAKLRPAHLQAVLDSMTEAGQSTRSVVHCYRVLHGALRQARRWLLISSNPAEAVNPPRPSRPELEIPDSAGLTRLVSAAESTPYAMAVRIAASSGMRRGELLGLRWRDVDLEPGRLRVTSTLQRLPLGDTTELMLTDPKTDRARREIALPLSAIDALRRYRREQAERRLALGDAWTDNDAVLDRGDGRWIDPEEFSRAFHEIAERAGLPRTRLHDVRHGFATALMTGGVHPKVASEALGHSSVAFTLDTYSHVVPSMQDAAAQAIEEALHTPTAVKMPSTQPLA